jgi:tetratricopeptide (TPR) repeat protein
LKARDSALGPSGSLEGGDGPSAWVAAIVLALAIALVYGRALDVPFVFDDDITITKNDSIKSLWPLIGTGEHHGPLNPPRPLPTTGRPLVNLTFAINYYFGKLNPSGYHAFNVVLHFLSTMLLWAIVRRTLRLPYFAGRFNASASWLALAVSLIWALHPLQTESVIYATQRTELMVGFFYLATMYCSLRYWDSLDALPSSGRKKLGRVGWLSLAVLACLCGMASKQVMASAPLMVLLFDRTFISGSLANALRRSYPLYAGLASTWLLLFVLNRTNPYTGSAGFDLGVPNYIWWLTQTKVVLMYLKLAVWPWPLLLHYQLEFLTSLANSWTYVVLLAFIGIGTVWLLWRNNPIGYLGTFVFAILAPTSVVPIVTEMAAERRMYLPLAALSAIFIVGGYWLAQRVRIKPRSRIRENSQESETLQTRLRLSATLKLLLVGLPVVLLAVLFGLISATRLSAYRDEVSMWRDVVRDQPKNWMAHNSLGALLTRVGGRASSDQSRQVAIGAMPVQPSGQADRSSTVTDPRLEEGISELRTAVQLNPGDVDALSNLAAALAHAGQYKESIDSYHRALQMEPTRSQLHADLGIALLNAGQLPQAIEELQLAVTQKPDDAVSLENLGQALMLAGRFADAIDYLKRAVALKPEYAFYHENLGSALAKNGQIPQAIEQYERALQLNPDQVATHNNLGMMLAATGDNKKAIDHFERALQIFPNYADAHFNLADLLERDGQQPKAIEHYRVGLQLRPGNLIAYAHLAQALAVTNQSKEAIAAAEKAIEVARATHQESAAQEMEAWLKRYQDELKKQQNATSQP